MAIRRSQTVLAAVGAVLLIAAAVLAFIVTPNLTKLPADTDLQFDYTGTATMLNAEALQQGDAANAFLADIPITMERRVRVTSTSGDVAVAEDQTTLIAGEIESPSTTTYAIDRVTMLGAAAPEGVEVEPAEGCLTVGFPPGPAADDSYTIYDAGTQECTTLTFDGEEELQGRTVHLYSTVATGPLKNEATLETLPPALPKDTLADLAPALPEDLQQQLAPALATLPDPVPLQYNSHTEISAEVDSQTGIPLSQELTQNVIVALEVDGELVDVTPVLAVNAELSEEARDELASTTKTTGRLLTILTATPYVLAVLGIATLLIAFLRRSRSGG